MSAEQKNISDQEFRRSLGEWALIELSGNMALFALRKKIAEGGEVEIPSLRVKITKDGVKPIVPDDEESSNQ